VKPWQSSGIVVVVLILSKSVSSGHRGRKRISGGPLGSPNDVILIHMVTIGGGPVGLVLHQLAVALGVGLVRLAAARPGAVSDARIHQMATRTATAKCTSSASSCPVCRYVLILSVFLDY